MIVTSALIIWKALICVTGSESPVVVVLSESMEPGFQRVSHICLVLDFENSLLIAFGSVVLGYWFWGQCDRGIYCSCGWPMSLFEQARLLFLVLMLVCLLFCFHQFTIFLWISFLAIGLICLDAFFFQGREIPIVHRAIKVMFLVHFLISEHHRFTILTLDGSLAFLLF